MPDRVTTDRIEIDTALCTACGRCVRACARGVLKVSGPAHLGERQVHVARPRDCHGCLSCVEACREGAIASRRTPREESSGAAAGALFRKGAGGK